MLTWENLLIMAASLAVILAAAASPAGWLVFAKNATLVFGFGSALMQADAAGADVAQNISSAGSRADLERAARSAGVVASQRAIAIGQALFFRALQKGPEQWKAAGGKAFHASEVEQVERIKSPPGTVTYRYQYGPGKIVISLKAHMVGGQLDMDAFNATLWHERFHAWVSPKFPP
jgi:hypothetical protein